MTKHKRVSTKSLVENPAFVDRRNQIGPIFHSYLLGSSGIPARARGNIRRESKEGIYEVVEDVCQFHRYLGEIGALSLARTYPVMGEVFSDSGRVEYTPRKAGQLMQELYEKMEAITDKYPKNNSLRNKLDEAEKYIWPNGRKQ